MGLLLRSSLVEGGNQGKEFADLFCAEGEWLRLQGITEECCSSFCVRAVWRRERNPVSGDMHEATQDLWGPQSKPPFSHQPARQLEFATMSLSMP